MELTLDTVLYKLRDLSPEIVSGSASRRLFSGAKHISYQNSSVSRSNLFVGFLSEALSVPNDDRRVFLCSCDLKNGREAAAGSGRNIVLFHERYHMEYLFDRILDVFEEVKDWDKALHVGSLEGKGLDHLVQISEEQIANPMLILDNSFNLLEYTRTIPTDYPLFIETIKNGYSPSPAINHLMDTGLFKQLYASDQPIIHQAAGSDAETNIYFKLAYGGLILGFAVVRCGTHVPEPGYVDLLSLFFHNVNLYFRQYFYPNRAGNFMYESFLQNLLASDGNTAHQAEAQSHYVKGIKSKSIYRLLQLSFPSSASLPLSFLAREISMAIPNLKPFLHEGSIYALREYPDIFSAEQPDTTEEYTSIETVLSKPSVVVAYSSVFFSITDLPNAKVQCEAAFRLREPSNRCIYYEKYKRAHILELVSGSMPPEFFLSSRYLRLQQYDEENGTELCKLLGCYFSCFMRTSDAARELYLHRNTVLSRLQKIEEIIGASLSDKEICEDLGLSIYIGKYLSSYGK